MRYCVMYIHTGVSCRAHECVFVWAGIKEYYSYFAHTFWNIFKSVGIQINLAWNARAFVHPKFVWIWYRKFAATHLPPHIHTYEYLEELRGAERMKCVVCVYFDVDDGAPALFCCFFFASRLKWLPHSALGSTSVPIFHIHNHTSTCNVNYITFFAAAELLLVASFHLHTLFLLLHTSTFSCTAIAQETNIESEKKNKQKHTFVDADCNN